MTDDYQIESMVTITGAEYVRLTAENAKLRAALDWFACSCTGDQLCRVPQKCRNYIARAALGGEND